MECNKKYYHNYTQPQKRRWYIEKVNLNHSLRNIDGCLKINESIDINFISHLNFST